MMEPNDEDLFLTIFYLDCFLERDSDCQSMLSNDSKRLYLRSDRDFLKYENLCLLNHVS